MIMEKFSREASAVYTPYLDQPALRVMNFVAVEPVVGGDRGLSELEKSGMDGKPVLFYARRLGSAPTRRRPPKPKLDLQGRDVTALLDGLNALGLTTAAAGQVQQVTQELFPSGTEGIDQGEVLRAVFLHLKRKNSADSVQR